MGRISADLIKTACYHCTPLLAPQIIVGRSAAAPRPHLASLPSASLSHTGKREGLEKAFQETSIIIVETLSFSPDSPTLYVAIHNQTNNLLIWNYASQRCDPTIRPRSGEHEAHMVTRQRYLLYYRDPFHNGNSPKDQQLA